MVLWLRQGISKTPSPRHFREGLHGKGSKGPKSTYRHSGTGLENMTVLKHI